MRGEPVAALVGAQKADAIVRAIEPDDRYPGRRSQGTRDVAASTCRQGDRPPSDISPTKAVVSDGQRLLPMGECDGGLRRACRGAVTGSG